MSAEAVAFSRSWPVGTARTCTLSVPPLKPGRPLHACIEWSPSVPSALTAAEWIDYRCGRDASVAAMAAAFGISLAVVELGGRRSEPP